MNDPLYDTAIIGGGLAGLSLSILLSRQGYKVILFEKESYPFHKVCGEYISMESWDFMESLGLPLDTMDLPVIHNLIVTSPDGTVLEQQLETGGFGISRYRLDNELKKIAIQNKVILHENCKVEDVIFADGLFTLKTAKGTYQSKTCLGSYGKRSNLDIKWKRQFTLQNADKLSNYIGIKYHIKTDHPADTIALHNFKNGYCGISKIEDGKYCLCYLTNAQNLKLSNNSINEMERTILSANPHLEQILTTSEKLYQSPVSISQVSFNKKTKVENHIIFLGDAAGMITPLCGNGMSIAMHSAKIASSHLKDFIDGSIDRQTMENSYTQEWKKNFESRLATGRLIQRFFGKAWVTNVFIRMMKISPMLTKKLIRKTHGESF